MQMRITPYQPPSTVQGKINFGDILDRVGEAIDIIRGGGTKPIPTPGMPPGFGTPLPYPINTGTGTSDAANQSLQRFLQSIIDSARSGIRNWTDNTVFIVRSIAGNQALPSWLRELANQAMLFMQGFQGGGAVSTPGPPLPIGPPPLPEPLPGGYMPSAPYDPSSALLGPAITAPRYVQRVQPQSGYVTVTMPWTIGAAQAGTKWQMRKDAARALGLWHRKPRPLFTAGDAKTLRKADRLEKKLTRLTSRHTDYRCIKKGTRTAPATTRRKR